MKKDSSDELDSLLSDKNQKKKKHQDILDQLNDLDNEEEFPLPVREESSFLPSRAIKKDEREKEDYDPDSWMAELCASTHVKVRKSKGRMDLFTSDYEKKKKKKKKKDKDGLVDFKKEFEPEAALYRNLLIDQNRFTESLQKQYDAMHSRKATARGTTKYESDLIKNITESRALATQLVEKNVNLKKLTNELAMKQKKEQNAIDNGDFNASDFASNYMKQLISEHQATLQLTNADIADYTEDEIGVSIENNLLSDDDYEARSDEVDKYLKYEHLQPQIICIMNPNDKNDYHYAAVGNDGNFIDDYPLPDKTTITVNESQMIATDALGQKYRLEWE